MRIIQSVVCIAGICTAWCVESISIIHGAQQLFGKATSTVQKGFKGVRNTLPGTVRWDDDNRTSTLRDVERTIDTTVRDVSQEVEHVINELHRVGDASVQQASHKLQTALDQLDHVIQRNTQNTGETIQNAITTIDTALSQHHEALDATMQKRLAEAATRMRDTLETVLEHAITQLDHCMQDRLEHAESLAQRTLSQSIRQGAYAMTGAACSGIGLVAITRPLWSGTTPPHALWHNTASAACLIMGLFCVGESEALAQRGIIGYCADIWSDRSA